MKRVNDHRFKVAQLRKIQQLFSVHFLVWSDETKIVISMHSSFVLRERKKNIEENAYIRIKS